MNISTEKIRVLLLLFIAVLESSEVDGSFETCPSPWIRKSTIIKTTESIGNGAEFLGKVTAFSSRKCHETCCKKVGCNLVMLKYEAGRKVSCFMFDCRTPSRCTFKEQTAYHQYAALDYTKPKYSSPKSTKNRHYTDKPEIKITTEFRTEEPTTKPTTELHKIKHWGNWNWFKTTTNPRYYKPKQNNGYDSAEKNWVDKVVSTTHHDQKPETHWDESSAKKDYDNSKYGSYDHSHDLDNVSPKKQTDGPTTIEWEDFPRRVFVDNNPDFPDEPKGDKIKPTVADSETAKPKNNNDKIPSSHESVAIATQPAGTEPVTKSRVSNVVIRRLNIQENKAVIPLAVGLVLALLLLMAVIFRVKTSRRRRTKAFLTDDADYLINGMYL